MSDEEMSVSDDVEVGSAIPEESSGVDSSPETSGQTSGQPQQQEVWSAFRTLPQFQGADDRAIAHRLYEALQREQSAEHALRQYQSTIPVVSEYLTNREMFDQWKAAQAQAQQPRQQQQMPAAPQETPWWNPPKIKDSYRQYLTRDENGREVISPDAPLDAKAALQEYQSYRADFARKFLENPEETLGPMVERVAAQRAQSIVRGQISRMQEESYVSNLEKENSDWLYDQQGNVSAEGLAVQKYIQDARQLGIKGAQARWDYATRMVERDLLVANMQRPQQPQMQMQPAPQPAAPPAQSPADAAAQRNMEYLRQQAMRTANQRPAQTTDARAPHKPMSFAEKLAASLHEVGMT
jgi:hypothetical protein